MDSTPALSWRVLDEDHLHTLEAKLFIILNTFISPIRASLFVSLPLPSNKLLNDAAELFEDESEPSASIHRIGMEAE